MIDSILIVLGVAGFGHFISLDSSWIQYMKYFACTFLFFYGALSFKSVKESKSLESIKDDKASTTARESILIILALSLLNPHVYLDTVVLLGSISLQYPLHDQINFAIGAILASFSWFFTITYGAKLLRPVFQKEISWKILDLLIGIIMWGIAITLIISLL